MFQRIVRECQIFGTSMGGLSQQKGNKEYPEAGDMAPVVYPSVEDSLFQIVLTQCKLFSTFRFSIWNC